MQTKKFICTFPSMKNPPPILMSIEVYNSVNELLSKLACGIDEDKRKELALAAGIAVEETRVQQLKAA